jgi:predicted HTH transcriptional regulator
VNTKFKSEITKAISLNRETDTIEFKDARSGLPSDIWRSITAFFNSPGGGYIIFGVKEDNKTRQMSVVGNSDIQSLQEKVVSYIENSISNKSTYLLEVVVINNKELLVLTINETVKE